MPLSRVINYTIFLLWVVFWTYDMTDLCTSVSCKVRRPYLLTSQSLRASMYWISTATKGWKVMMHVCGHLTTERMKHIYRRRQVPYPPPPPPARVSCSQQTLQCWINAGPASQTVAQYWTNIGPLSPAGMSFSNQTYRLVCVTPVVMVTSNYYSLGLSGRARSFSLLFTYKIGRACVVRTRDDVPLF